MSDIGSIESLDWEVISYAHMISLKDESRLYIYKNGRLSSLHQIVSKTNAVASGSSQLVTETEEIMMKEVVSASDSVQVETNVNVKVSTEMNTVTSEVALETVNIMTQLNSIDVIDRRRRENESFQFKMARPRQNVKTIGMEASLEIDEWEVVPERYLVGVTRSVMEGFKTARAAKIKSLDQDMEVMVEKFNKIDILTVKWIKKQAENAHLLPTQIESHCPSCNNLLAKKKKNHCKICSTVICPKCSKFVDFKQTRHLLCQNATVTLQSKFLNKYYEMLRLCENCDRLIELRKFREERHTAAYPLVEKHQVLRDLIEQTKPIVAIFKKINQSLMNGETQYHLSDLIAMSQRINKMADEIGWRARDISATPAQPGTRQATLLAAIKNVATVYVKDNLLPLRLPTQSQVEEARQNRFEMYSSRLRFKKKQPIVRKKES